MFNKKSLVGLFAIPLLLLCGVLQGDQRLAGGWIDSYSGSAEAYTLLRDGQRVPIAIYMPVYLGDRINVNPGHVLNIGRSDGSILKIDTASGEYSISEPDRTVTLLDNFLLWAGKWFGRYAGGEQDTQVISMVSRWEEYPPISMSLFPTGQARLLAGQRSVALYWEGGEPPFGIRMHASDKDELLVNLEGIGSGMARIGPLDFRMGTYYLEVYDRNEVEIVRLDVVPEERYPGKPAELRNAEMPVKVMNNLEAMWLAGQEDGDWTLEAYQLLAESGDESSAAVILRSALEKGIVLKQ